MRFSKTHTLIAFALSALLLLCLQLTRQNTSDETIHHLENFKIHLREQQTLLRTETALLLKKTQDEHYASHLQNELPYFNTLREENGISLYVYEDSALTFWSNNADPVEKISSSTQGFVKIAGRYYEKYSMQKQGKTVVALLLIKKEPPFENEFVKTYFQSKLNLPAQWSIVISQKDGPISSLSKNTMQVQPSDNAGDNTNPIAYICLEILALLLLLFALYQSILQIKLPFYTKALLFATALFLLRYAMLLWHFPFYLYQSEIMDPQLFAYSSWLPSLGDLLLNALVLLIAVIFIGEAPLPKNNIADWSLGKKYLLLFCSFATLFYCSWLVIEIIEILVFNSNVVLDAKKILNANIYSTTSIFAILIYLYAYLLLVKKVAALLKCTNIEWHNIALYHTAFFAVAVLLCYSTGVDDIMALVLILPLLLLVEHRVFRALSDFDLTSSLFLILFLSLFISATLEKYLEIKESSTREQKAVVMGSERDPFAEYLYLELNENLKKDEQITAIQDSTVLANYLRKRYFNKYWDKFELYLTTKTPDYRIFAGTEIIANTLYHNNRNGRGCYSARITAATHSETWIELYPKNTPDELGFPILLTNKAHENASLQGDYTYAKYYKGKLVSSRGNFNYPLILTILGKSKSEFQWIERNGMKHLLYAQNNDSTIVISSEDWSVWRMLSSYSYLFILLSGIAIIAYIGQSTIGGKNTLPTNFKMRLQLSMLTMLLFSGIIIGASSIYFINKQYNKKNFESINEKIKSVKLDVERRLIRKNAFDSTEYIKETLDRYAKVFFTDINLYNTRGQLVTSSRPDIFKEGLVSANMDPAAYKVLHFEQQSHFIGLEKIEGLEYLSAYTPIYNEKSELEGYLNLPYFGRQNELSNEIANFLVALINIYGLLIVFSILAALFVSARITKPLSLIQDRLKNMRLGKRNESIEWQSNDEIGSLVTEYNRMVNELSDNTERLAKSEREGAWREMAKQVAHEIKNPLTPMKLHVQHLNRLWKDLPHEEFEERLQRISSSLIEQIDTLSSIATEFSNFAKMPDPIIEDVDLVNVLRNCVELYSNENSAAVTLQSEYNTVLIKADKDQLLRVFNNLIKNAIQAIPENRKGKVTIGLTYENNAFVVRIEDNGKGISENDREKIFIPNFTTKNSGMGLGLAMVKKIVEGMNGSIWFESQPDKGTCFYIAFKK